MKKIYRSLEYIHGVSRISRDTPSGSSGVTVQRKLGSLGSFAISIFNGGLFEDESRDMYLMRLREYAGLRDRVRI